MKRPILVATISYINGIIIGVYLDKSIPLFIILSLIIVLFISIRKIKYKNIIIFYILILIITSIYTYKKDLNYEKKYLQYDGFNINIEGTIISNIEEKDYKYTFIIKVEKLNNNNKFKNDKLLINIKKTEEMSLGNIEYGNKIKIKGEYEEPSKARNYKGFNYKDYLKTQKIYGTITVKNLNNIIIVKKNNVSVIDKYINNIREKVKNNLRAIMPENTSALAMGILIGYDNEISQEITQSFKDSNLSHMLAISGAHTNYVILAISLFFSKKRLGVRKQKIIIIILMLIFMKITEMTPSVVRAGFTCIIYMLASLLFRKADTANTIAIVTLLTIVDNPFSIFNVGMQLSYAGSISIILFYNILEKRIKVKNRILKYIEENIVLTISANIFIIPIMWYQFNTISLTFIFSNLFASPVLGISIILGLILIIISFISLKIAIIPAHILNYLLIIVIKISEFFGKMSISKITVITPSIILVILYYITCIVIIYNNKKQNKIKKKYIIIIIIIAIVLKIFIMHPIDKKLIINFIDVGQGDSTLIQTTSNKKILIDGGGSTSANSFDVGSKTLLPYLLDRKINKIDYIMISHFDADHCQGVEAVIKNIKVENLIISKQPTITEEYKTIINICKSKKINIIIVKRGDTINIDKNLYIKILHPSNKFLEDGKYGLNANAIVCKLYYKINNNKYYTMLFTGDIEEEAEKELEKIYQNELKSDILKVAHHGSKTSSREEFLKLVSPKISLIGVGEDNKFGHPNELVLERLKQINSQIYRTDLNGEISISINIKGKILIKTQI